MKGFIIIYNSSKKRDITKINYFLFGRISTITVNNNKVKYYYPGFFENTPYKKIANGCYFVENIGDDYNGLLKIIPSDILFDNSNMLNARDYWRNKINGEVINW